MVFCMLIATIIKLIWCCMSLYWSMFVYIWSPNKCRYIWSTFIFANFNTRLNRFNQIFKFIALLYLIKSNKDNCAKELLFQKIKNEQLDLQWLNLHIIQHYMMRKMLMQLAKYWNQYIRQIRAICSSLKGSKVVKT